MSAKAMIVLRPMGPATTAAKMALGQQADELQKKLEASDKPVVVVGDVAIYWLRPGESTEEMDARAEAIRAEAARA